MRTDVARFESIKKEYGHCASWAIWATEGSRPKDNIGDLSVLDPTVNPVLLHQLRPSIVLVGLNISRGIEAPLGNFHDPRPQAMDYKLRFAFKGTPFWGAYMTDIIKDFKQEVSGNVLAYLRNHGQFEQLNVATFRMELRTLGADKPTLVAFGKGTHAILARHLGNEFTILGLPHYSNFVGKEEYRRQVHSILGFQ
jgi:hypothetical protein